MSSSGGTFRLQFSRDMLKLGHIYSRNESEAQAECERSSKRTNDQENQEWAGDYRFHYGKFVGNARGTPFLHFTLQSVDEHCYP